MKRNIVSILFIVIVLLALFVMSIWSQGENFFSLTHDGDYDLFHGSSFATAFVTGVVAHYLSQNEVARNRYTQVTIFNYLESISVSLNDNQEKVGNGIPIITD